MKKSRIFKPTVCGRYSFETRLKMSLAAIKRGGRPPTEEHKQKLRDKMNAYYSKGHRSGNWKGGKYYENGYVRISEPGHPKANKRGYVFEHRIIAEKCLGRFLEPMETVHHINRIRNDNRPENLMVFKSKAAHVSMDKWGVENPTLIIFDGRTFRD